MWSRINDVLNIKTITKNQIVPYTNNLDTVDDNHSRVSQT